MKFTHSFKHTLPLRINADGLYGDLDAAKDVEMDTSVSIDPDHQYGGWYETYDLETGGDRFYAEGVLETYHDEDGSVRLTGYDGCFELLNTLPMLLKRRA